MPSLRPALLLPLLLAVVTPAGVSAAAEPPLPQPPCGPGDMPFPAYAAPDAPPAVATWRDLVLPGEGACFGQLAGPTAVVVALAGRFRFGGSLDDLAARIGAISKTAGLRYWSTGEQKWRRLISEAWALSGPEVAARRQDFTAAEIRTPGRRYFAQNDTRSTGANLYSLITRPSAPDRLAVEIANESPLSLSLLRLFDEAELLSLVMVEHLGGDLWGYYGVMAARDSAAEGYEKSLVNRAAAFQRFLLERPGDDAPPLAK